MGRPKPLLAVIFIAPSCRRFPILALLQGHSYSAESKSQSELIAWVRTLGSSISVYIYKITAIPTLSPDDDKY
jgi:hypothetical protein